MLLQVPACVNTFLRCIFKVFQSLWSFLPSHSSSLARHGCKQFLWMQIHMGPLLSQHCCEPSSSTSLLFFIRSALSFSLVGGFTHPTPRQHCPASQHVGDPPLQNRRIRLTILVQSLLRVRAKTTARGAQAFIFALLSQRFCLAEGNFQGWAEAGEWISNKLSQGTVIYLTLGYFSFLSKQSCYRC